MGTSSVIYWNPSSPSQLPKDIVVDTNVLLDLHRPNHNRTIVSQNFFDTALEQGCRLYLTSIHKGELVHQLSAIYSKQYAKENLNLDFQDYSDRGNQGYKIFLREMERRDSSSTRTINQRVKSTIETMETMTEFIPINQNSEAFTKMHILRDKVGYEVESNDLFGIIGADEYGINSIVSADAGLKKIPGINLILITETPRRPNHSEVFQHQEGELFK